MCPSKILRNSPFLPPSMVCKAKSILKKDQKAFLEKDLRLKQAVAAWHEEQKKPKEDRLSASKIAQSFQIPPQTLSDHVNKKHLPQLKYIQSRQTLTPVQEEELVVSIQTLDSWGMPPGRMEIKKLANSILNRGHTGASRQVDDSWFKRFLSRHQKELCSRWSSPLDKARADGLNAITWKQHFDLVEETWARYSIEEDCDFGFDESPVTMGTAPKQRVYGRTANASGKRVQQSYQRRDGNRETLTAAETICADGTSLKPMIIMRGAALQKSWGGKVRNSIGAL